MLTYCSHGIGSCSMVTAKKQWWTPGRSAYCDTFFESRQHYQVTRKEAIEFDMMLPTSEDRAAGGIMCLVGICTELYLLFEPELWLNRKGSAKGTSWF